MNETEKNKISRFLSDEVMSKAVREVIEHSIIARSKDRDVQNLAARFLCIEIIQEAWQELEKYKIVKDNETKLTSNIGV